MEDSGLVAPASSTTTQENRWCPLKEGVRTLLTSKQVNQFCSETQEVKMNPKRTLIFIFGFLILVISIALIIIGAGNIDIAHSIQLTERACVNINGVKW